MEFAKQTKILLLLLILLSNFAFCDSVSYGNCQTACNKGAMVCYKIAGVVYGVGSVPACGLAQGSCMAACFVFSWQLQHHDQIILVHLINFFSTHSLLFWKRNTV